MENRKTFYTNSYAMTRNSDTDEVCITFLRAEPIFDLSKISFSNEVISDEHSIIIPLSVAKKLVKSLSEVVNE